MAVPAFLFIENFEPMLAAGLGFAAGARRDMTCMLVMRSAVMVWLCGSVVCCDGVGVGCPGA
jgi:hypothetical protein